MSHPLEPPRAYQGHLYIYKTYLYYRPEYDVKLLISFTLIQSMTTITSSFDAWFAIHYKQEEYWQKYMDECDTCYALYCRNLSSAAKCAEIRANEWYNKYTISGEIKNLFN